jgi:uncharacterized membrane protein YvbJ
MAMKKCIACSEKIQEEALLCRFCNTRQDDLHFATNDGSEEVPITKDNNKPVSSRKRLYITIGVSLAAFLTLILVVIASGRADIVPQIEQSVKDQADKISVLGMMGSAANATCTPQGLSLFMGETEYKCFVSDVSGKGLVFKATMNWDTGVYQYGLDR